MIAFDKTGTLTEGRPRVTEIVPCAGFEGGERELLRIAASVEASSEHPLAESVLRAAETREISPSGVLDFHSVPGRGVRAKVEGHEVRVGSLRFLSDEGIDVDSLESAATGADERGAGILAVAHDGMAAGVIAVEDTLRPEAAEAVATLRRMGLRPVMLTGDRDGPARAIATEAGVPDEAAPVFSTVTFGVHAAAIRAKAPMVNASMIRLISISFVSNVGRYRLASGFPRLVRQVF